MTARSMFDWLAELLETRSYGELARYLGIDLGVIDHSLHRQGMNLSTLRRIHERTRVPIGVLAEKWLEGQAGYWPPHLHEKAHGLDAIDEG